MMDIICQYDKVQGKEDMEVQGIKGLNQDQDLKDQEIENN